MTMLAWAEVSLPALTHNFLQLQQQSPNAQAMPVIKANAYGHGAIKAAQALAVHVSMFAVARIDEAIALRDAGIAQEITVLSGCFDNDAIKQCMTYNLTPCIYNPSLIDAVNEHSQLRYWLKINSGMNRLGLNPEQAAQWLKHCQTEPFGLISHFSSADETSIKNAEQLALIQSLPAFKNISLANSAAITYLPQSHHQWVRPGIALYGIQPSKLANHLQLQAVMTLKARVIQLQHLPKGAAIGYGERFICPKDTVIATVSVGYADGYPRHAPDGTPVLINGVRCPLAGRVSMDLITVDVSAIAADIRVGQSVTLWGQGLPCEEIADYADTIAYELVSKVTARVPRVYSEV